MIKFPFTSLQQFNLDWIMQQLHKILDFMPLNGVAGDVLQRTADGAAWQPIAAISMDIHSLNPIGDPVAGNDELPIYDNSAQGIYKATVTEIMAEAPVQSVNGQTGVVVIGDAVDSVNGQTGVVVLDASDVGALPDTTVIPTDTGDLTNGAGFVDAAGAAAAAPVQSVNGLTGSVTITVPTNTNELTNGAGFVDAAGAAAAAPVQSVNGQTGAVVVGGGSGIDLLGGTAGVCSTPTVTGIGTISDIGNLVWRMTSDKKWIMLYGWFTVSFSTTGDVTLIDLAGFTLNSTGATAAYAKGAVDVVNSSGQINLALSKTSGFLRLNSDVLRIALDDPGTTGTFTVLVHPTLLQLDT